MIRAGHNFKRSLTALAAAWTFAACTSLVSAQYRTDTLQLGTEIAAPNPQIVERPNAVIPADLEFTRSDGKTIKLAELFDQKKPVILDLVYFSFPSLCGYSQTTLADAIRSGPRSLELGKDYTIVIVSIDPDDTPAAAAAKRTVYLNMTGRPESQPGFTYLTGSQENIEALADTVGFGFRRNFNVAPEDAAGKFAHSSGIFVLTPGGRLSQTIQGINYPVDTLHFALLQASSGKIGSGFLETIALPCGAMRLNPNTGHYEHNPWFWAGTAGGGASLAFMTIFLAFMWRGEWKRSHATSKPETQDPKLT